MAAYATAERTAHTEQFPQVAIGLASPPTAMVEGSGGFNTLLDHLAERVAARLAAPVTAGDEWLDTREAATYLAVHRDTIRRLAAERVVPSEQDGPGCKLFFRRSDLDAWRCGAGGALRLVSGDRR